MTNKPLIIFDLDGTLNQTELHSVPAQMQVLREFGVSNISPEKIKGTFGATYEEYTETLLPGYSEERKQAYLKRVLEVESEFLFQYGHFYPGTDTMLDDLHHKGYFTAVCSNASEKYITTVLKTLSLTERIDYIQPLIRGKSKKDSLRFLLSRIQPSASVMVGDTVFDMEAARANRIPFAGCLYGYRPHEMQGADALLRQPMDLLAVVDRLLAMNRN